MRTLKYLLPVSFLAVLLLSSFILLRKAPSHENELKKKSEGIEWLTLEEAYKRNQKHPRKIFVDVYTDWCGWCKRMDKSTFTSPDVTEYVGKNYYAVKLNAESETEMNIGGEKMTGRMVAQAFRVNSYPTIVFIQEDFRTIFPVPGYREATEFLTVLKNFKETKVEKNKDDKDAPKD